MSPLPIVPSDAPAPFKVVNSEKLVNALGYTFLHPDPVG